MINLLPDIRKDDIKAARANVILLRYMAIIGFAFAFIGGAVYISYSVLQTTMASAEERVALNDTKADVYSATRQEVDELSSKLNDAKSILDQEIRYSQVLIKLGQLTPAGVVLGNLTLDAASFDGNAVELQAYAKSNSEASQLQSQLQSSPLFSAVTLKSTEGDKGIDGYPVLVTLTVTLNKAGV